MRTAKQNKLFFAIPVVIILLIVGLLLTRSDSETIPADSADTTAFVPHQADEYEAESGELLTDKPDDKREEKQVAVAPTEVPTHAPGSQANEVVQVHAAQMAKAAERANLQIQRPPEPWLNQEQNQAPSENNSDSESPDPREDESQISFEMRVRDALKSLDLTVQKCHQTLRKDFPDAGDNVSVRFAVSTRNGQSHVQIPEILNPPPTPFERALHDCLSRPASRLVLPKSSSSTTLWFTHTYRFGP